MLVRIRLTLPRSHTRLGGSALLPRIGSRLASRHQSDKHAVGMARPFRFGFGVARNNLVLLASAKKRPGACIHDVAGSSLPPASSRRTGPTAGSSSQPPRDYRSGRFRATNDEVVLCVQLRSQFLLIGLDALLKALGHGHTWRINVLKGGRMAMATLFTRRNSSKPAWPPSLPTPLIPTPRRTVGARPGSALR